MMMLRLKGLSVVIAFPGASGQVKPQMSKEDLSNLWC